MCGRYTITTPAEELAERFEAALPEVPLRPRYNAAPTQDLPVILNEDAGQIRLVRWGLVPFWAKDPSIGNRMINARAETLREKPSFRNSLKRRRCLVLADGFYEWQKSGAGKVPVRITLADGSPFAFAGLWDEWEGGEGEPLRTFTIVTVPPNDLVGRIHNRMPAILLPEHERLWLAEEGSVEEWLELLRPYPAERLVAYAVSRRVNSPANDDPSVIEPVESGP